MLGLFKNSQNTTQTNQDIQNFDYLDKNAYYFDSACQTLRPQSVINSEVEYYQKFNSCGHRVKYPWGEKTDKLVEECRENLIKLTKKNSKDYTIAFNLNTTSGINQILFQLNPDKYDGIVTSEIEHNSVFLPSLVWSQRNNKERLVLERKIDGGLDYKKEDLKNKIVLLNSTSNIDGRTLKNISELAKDIKEMGGLFLIDACQTLGHGPELLEGVDFDAAFGSGHKMYGPSVGFIIIKKSLVKNLNAYLIGGSTVSMVSKDEYDLISDDEEIYARIEPGLQNYAGIIGLNESLKWRKSFKSESGLNASEYEHELAEYLHEKLKEVKNIKLVSQEVSGTVSIYSDKMDGNKLAIMLGQAGIMCRSGYHCCHYYLHHKLKLPPLFRVSVGLNNTKEQIDYLIDKMKIVMGS
jgi:selenocysteine lyase/cysteine desulfurase